jgi:insertion element IS1 protein InsB
MAQDNSLNIRNIPGLIESQKTSSIGSCLKRFLWLESPVQLEYPNGGCKPTRTKNIKPFPGRSRWRSKTRLRLTVEGDELCSFVGNKQRKQWVWLAIDRDSREIAGVFMGDRSAKSAQALGDSLPEIYRQCAISYTDFWKAYRSVFPKQRHRAAGKESGQTNRIERFNNTLRQKVSRLVRETLSFSKKIENHIGAIWNFLRRYTANLRGALSMA